MLIFRIYKMDTDKLEQKQTKQNKKKKKMELR